MRVMMWEGEVPWCIWQGDPHLVQRKPPEKEVFDLTFRDLWRELCRDGGVMD